MYIIIIIIIMCGALEVVTFAQTYPPRVTVVYT